jgi:uncharacterized PurR-regulated membrane protein YhhQ (DUF165 family)
MHNEILFFLQIIIIGIFLSLFAKKKYISLLSNLFIHLFIFLNLISANEISIFSLHCSIVEPFGILMYFMTVFLYSWDKNTVDDIFKNIYIINIFLFIIFLITLQYSYVNNSFIIIILKEYIYNTFISIISLHLSYYTERHAFNKIQFLPSPIREGISVAIGQLFDTLFYTILIFFNRPYKIIIEIIFCSYIIKLFCIFCYTSFLFYKKNN